MNTLSPSSLKDLEEVRAANRPRLLAVAASVQHAIKITNTKLEATK